MTSQIPTDFVALRALAGRLVAAGQRGDGRLLLSHLNAIAPNDVATLRELAAADCDAGDFELALHRLRQLQAIGNAPADTQNRFQGLLAAAAHRFNALVAQGEVAEAYRVASFLARLLPNDGPVLNSALSCAVATGDRDGAMTLATALLALDPQNDLATSIVRGQPSVVDELDERYSKALSPDPTLHPLLKLRDLHDAASAILCRELTGHRIEQVRALVKAANSLHVDAPLGTDLEGWLKHYRLATQALNVDAIVQPARRMREDEETWFTDAAGRTMGWENVQLILRDQNARCVFFAAADERYVELYARPYVRSVLRHCDTPCVVVLHVIGGADRLSDIARSIGLEDRRLVLAGDRFDASRVAAQCFDTPPKGRIPIPVAHYQSVRFLRLGALLRHLRVPVFVSDIDLLLQRGVGDLLARCAGHDVTFNENDGNTNAGSRLTANLLLAAPTENTAIFLDCLTGYLTDALSRPEVSRWIDQFGLLIARHHVMRHGVSPKLGYFDTSLDINNVMFPSYQPNPFRFLSLYHGFDMSSLDAAA